MCSLASIFCAKDSTCLRCRWLPCSTQIKKDFCVRLDHSFRPSAGAPAPSAGGGARPLGGRAILYADVMTDSMRRAIDETERRRAIQRAYNEENGITPESIVRPPEYSLAKITDPDATELTEAVESVPDFNSQEDLDKYIAKLEQQMREAAKRFEFETAAKLRDTIKDLRSKEILII